MSDFDEATAAWTAAFVKAQSQLLNPPKTKTAKVKTKTGADYQYRYAELPDIIDSVRQVLFENGLAVAQAVVSQDSTVGVATTIYHSAGHSEYLGPLYMPAGSTPQEYGSAITYARRYALCAALGIAAEDDDDGAVASRKKSEAEPSRKAGTLSPAAASDPTSPPSGTTRGGGVVDGEAAASSAPTKCDHPNWSDKKEDGMLMPWSRERCTECGYSRKRQGASS